MIFVVQLFVTTGSSVISSLSGVVTRQLTPRILLLVWNYCHRESGPPVPRDFSLRRVGIFYFAAEPSRARSLPVFCPVPEKQRHKFLNVSRTPTEATLSADDVASTRKKKVLCHVKFLHTPMRQMLREKLVLFAHFQA